MADPAAIGIGLVGIAQVAARRGHGHATGKRGLQEGRRSHLLPRHADAAARQQQAIACQIARGQAQAAVQAGKPAAVRRHVQAALQPRRIGDVGQPRRQRPANRLGNRRQDVGIGRAVHAQPAAVKGIRLARGQPHRGQKLFRCPLCLTGAGQAQPHGRLVQKGRAQRIGVVFDIVIVDIHVQNVLYRRFGIPRPHPGQIPVDRRGKIDLSLGHQPPDDQHHRRLRQRHDGMRLIGAEIRGVALEQHPLTAQHNHGRKERQARQLRHIRARRKGHIRIAMQRQDVSGAEALHIAGDAVQGVKAVPPCVGAVPAGFLVGPDRQIRVGQQGHRGGSFGTGPCWRNRRADTSGNNAPRFSLRRDRSACISHRPG